MRRIPQWLQASGRLVLTSLLVTTGVIFIPRLSSFTGCMTLSNAFGGDMLILDSLQGRFAKETRISSPTSWLSNDDYYVATTATNTGPGRFRLTLQPVAEGEPILLQPSVYMGGSFWNPARAAWSPDGDLLAYLWQDAEYQHYFSIFSLADKHTETTPLSVPHVTLASLIITGWSGDQQYLSVQTMDMSTVTFHGIWSVERRTLEPLPANLPQIVVTAWSAKGHHLAVTTVVPTDGQQLQLLDAADFEQSLVSPLMTQGVVQALSWSPEGQYLVVARLDSRVDSRLHAARQWYFDVYDAAGEAIQANIPGKTLLPTPKANTSGIVVSVPNIVPGYWSSDGQSWVYLQDTLVTHHPRTRLMRFEPASERYALVEDNIVSTLYPQMFQLPQQYIFPSNGGILPLNTSLILPQWRDGMIALDYIDQTGVRTTLVEGASAVLLDAYYYRPYQQFRWNTDQFLIPWQAIVDGRTETRVTVRRTVNGQAEQYTVTGLHDIQQMLWLTADWLGFITSRDGEQGVALINLVTQDPAQWVAMREDEESWYGIASPDAQHVALRLTRRQSFTTDTEGRLVLVALQEGSIRDLDTKFVGFGSWSADGQRYAFLQVPQIGRRSSVRVVNNAGTIVSDTLLPAGMNRDSVALSLWTSCDANSEAG